tara:strand:- start:1397 stop:1996 length:600 start_codon:yes stop_codon:yes gene_type:complete
LQHLIGGSRRRCGGCTRSRLDEAKPTLLTIFALKTTDTLGTICVPPTRPQHFLALGCRRLHTLTTSPIHTRKTNLTIVLIGLTITIVIFSITGDLFDRPCPRTLPLTTSPPSRTLFATITTVIRVLQEIHTRATAASGFFGGTSRVRTSAFYADLVSRTGLPTSTTMAGVALDIDTYTTTHGFTVPTDEFALAPHTRIP